ncbi:Bifunctional protein PutA [Rubripirellula obstinata]|uniref:L-glutamate gamma-semialdehyde dehydrogenase n=1 Tax=Rubripirellula obstinata TaxID=406547 RepID=A0A5B1CLN9_9BACT|nr:bifunctional proline dehydrogenase/L-glutamate gamma-semialdehyde dehydrogenase [Rubripirellula obstinata]KAA1260450.1 Bifunctional protein PutA [Rubripirellula obstinata]
MSTTTPLPFPALSAEKIDSAIDLARTLLDRAAKLQTTTERRQQAELDRMIQHPDDKATMVEITDQAFRTHCSARVADQLTHLLDVQGVPRFFSPVEQAMLRGFQAFGEYLPGVAVPLVKEKMRQETANTILPAEPDLLRPHLKARLAQGVGMNVNLLGEAVLGEEETRKRMVHYVEALRLPEVQCVSIKISTIDSQISSIAREHTVRKVSDRLEQLYRTANHEKVPGTDDGKFVYLDMEEYRDLYLTSEVMMETLDRPGLEKTRAGIALQAYIPDSYQVLMTLIVWSRKRVAAGATPLTIRLVKGANLEMERVESSISGHPQAPFTTKTETDANYKKMLRELFIAAADGVVRVGLASHNLFDVALGMVWCRDKDLSGRIQMEMLEGMANHQRRAISEHFDSMLLYAPACRREHFINAIGYLIRRLDENTGEQNFLRHAFKLKSDSEEFKRLADDFRQSVDLAPSLDTRPRRRDERRNAPAQPVVSDSWQHFENEPDTDWGVPDNAAWIQETLDRWRKKKNVCIDDDGDQTTDDPSRPGVVVCRYRNRSIAEVKEAVRVADQDPSGWQTKSIGQIHEILRAVAQQIRVHRGDMIGVMVAEGGKTVLEADPEISEAIDFCEFYPLTVIDWKKRSSLSIEPRGVVAVITPWNFPLAIPCGGIAAALAMGNRVLLKPSAETTLIAKMLCDAFWDAGVPRDVLHFVPCDESVAQEGLVENELVDTVILTGATSTAKKMLSVRPSLHLLAETGGKNATIVTAMADRELAIKHVLHSAFGHAGQKCSATSLLLLEDEVFDDETFKQSLADAVNSLDVGSAWKLHNKMGPLIAPPGPTLTRGLKTLEDDESWLVTPQHIITGKADGNAKLYRPGVKWNVKPGGFSHMNEMFGPVLGVIRFSKIEEAIAIVQSTGYGLTSGLESLDDREIQLWKEAIPAGNLYINRPTTGAIVLRQPFGGVGLSAYGPGVKAGGPHYVLALAKIENGNSPALADNSPSHPLLDSLDNCIDRSALDASLKTRLLTVSQSARVAYRDEFSREHDTLRLLGQDNLRRYRSLASVTVRLDRIDSLDDALVAAMCSVAAMTPISLSMDPTLKSDLLATWNPIADALPRYVQLIVESDAELADRIQNNEIDRLRLLRRLDSDSPIAKAATQQFVTIISEPVVDEGHVEILRYMNEQSISHDYHRYGNLGRRAGEDRRPPS